MKQDMILRLLRKSDNQALEYLYDKYSLLLLRFINLYVSDKDLAKDILQETFLSLWNARGDLADNTQFDKFLFTIAKNKSLNAIRTVNNRMKHTISASRLPEKINMEFLGAYEMDSMEEEDLKTEITELYNSLPDTYREIFVMSRVDDLTYSQIASELAISHKTVEKKISRVLSILRKKTKEKMFLCMVLPILMCCLK